MSQEPFYVRSAAIVSFCNTQLGKAGDMEIAASAAHAAARYSVWAIANTTATGAELRSKKDEAIEKFLNGYRMFLEQNFADYIEHHALYYPPSAPANKT